MVPLRTIAALLADANAAENLAERERSISAAVNQASTFRDWEAILDGLPASVPIERRRELAERALVSARDRMEIWGFRNVARFQALTLGDPDSARATLRDAEQMLIEMTRAGRALGFYWGILADAFKVALRDRSEARRSLCIGWDLAWSQRDVENLGRLVNQWAKQLDRSEARERLIRVEQVAVAWGNLGGVIYWWHALGDAEAGRRVRQATLESATRFEEVIHLARYWNLYEKNSPGVEAAFARAEVLARTAAEWLELAQQANTEENNTLRRRALDRAATVADSSEMKARIASAYVEWFEDHEAADRVGPRGVRPNDVRPRQMELDGWVSSASDLFDWLRVRTTKEHLANIAEADYGDDAQRHLAALEEICKSGFVPLELPWHPGEVVALTRWSSGDAVDHIERTLSCVLLCVSRSEDEVADTGPPLIESCLALGDDASACGERLLAWKCETGDPEAGEPLVALLLLFMLHAAREPNDPRLVTLLREMALAPDIPSLRESIATSVSAALWTQLIDSIVMPLHRDWSEFSPLLDAIGFPR